MRKVRTTISLSKDLVKKAKELDINVSETAEKILESLTVEDESEKKLKERKIEFLKFLLPILEKKRIQVEVGYLQNSSTIKKTGEPTTVEEAEDVHYYHHYVYLTPSGMLWVDAFEKEYPFQQIINDPNFDFYQPAAIFKNLMEAIEKKKEINKKRVEEFETVKKIMQAIMPEEGTEKSKGGGVKKS